MKKILLAALAASTLAGPALADPPGWAGNPHRDGRWERHEDRRDWREDRREGRGDRREWRDDRRDYRHDGRWDRRDWRFDNGRWRGPSYYYPQGYGYRSWAPGIFLPRPYLQERYFIYEPDFYRLPPPGYGARWVRVGPDALLIRLGDGFVLRVVRGLYW